MSTGFAGGLAQGLQGGISAGSQIRQINLRKKAQEAEDELQLKKLKIEQDALKFKQLQAKKQAEISEIFFQELGKKTEGKAKEEQIRSILEARGGPTVQAGQQLQAAQATPSATTPEQFFRLQQLAAQTGMEDQFQQAIKQGFIQTPASIRQQREQSQEVRLASEKTRAQIGKLNADAEKARRPPVPNKVGLALEAAGGDPVAAMGFLNPARAGLNIEFDESGRPTSISTGSTSNKLLSDQITGIQGLNNSAQPIRALRDLLQQDTTSPTIQGQLRALGTSLKANIAAFSPTGPKGKEIKQRIQESQDVSKFEFLAEMAAFSVAAINNPGGRISDADVESARKSLGLGGGAFARPRASELIIPRLDAALSLLEQKVQAHQQTIQALQGGQIQTGVSPSQARRQRPATAQDLSGTSTQDIEAELRRLQGG